VPLRRAFALQEARRIAASAAIRRALPAILRARDVVLRLPLG
jgi:hypothetical protein